MIYLIIHVFALVAFGQGLRLGQKRTGNIIGVSAVNYVVASLIAVPFLGFMLSTRGTDASTVRLGMIGISNGCMYFLCLLVMLKSYEIAGVGITSAIIACGCVVPVIVARVIGWETELLVTQWLAVALLPVAVFLMRPLSKERKQLNFKADMLLLAAFCVPAISSTIHAAAARWGGGELPGQATYTAGIFAAALISTGAFALWRRERITRPQVALGTGIGLVNILATVMLVAAVRLVGAAVFFPTASCAVIILHLFLSWRLWKETLTKRQFGGVLAAIAVIILANISK